VPSLATAADPNAAAADDDDPNGAGGDDYLVRV